MPAVLRRRAVFTCLAVVAALGALAFGSPVRADGVAMFDSEEQVDCETAQLLGPEAISAAALTGTPERISLDVLLLVDFAEGAAIASIADAAERAAAEQALYDAVAPRLEPVGAGSYAPLGIDLKFSGFGLLAPLAANGTPRDRTVDSQSIINLAKQQLGGGRPAGIDLVYVATDLDMTAPGLGSAVAGQADCIGGVAHADRAFAVGEVGVLVEDDAGIAIGPIAFYKDLAAKIFAHELGHLMGGHHHYQECGTPGPTLAAAGRGEPGPCTLMTNAVDFQTTPFSNLNSAIVRGHAEEFVLPFD